MVEFRKITPDQPKSSARSDSESLPVRVPFSLAGQAEAEERLFYFLRSLRDGRPQAGQPLLVDADTLAALYASPQPALVEVLRHCLDNFLVELGPNPASWGSLDLSPALWGVALALHNCLVPGLYFASVNFETSPRAETAAQSSQGTHLTPVAEFTAALIDTLPPAQTLAENLAYHALLRQPAEALPYLPAGQAALLQALLNRIPLSAIYNLHHYTPPALTPLAAELLPGWRTRRSDYAPWTNPAAWLAGVALLLDRPALAAYVRRRWLSLAETRPACRNLGLLLEALRRTGNHRNFILEFYEAYEYTYAETSRDAWGHARRYWPVLATIERLLHAGREVDPAHETALAAALRLNRHGNEYFLKFYPLVHLIIAEGRPPTDYNHLRDLPLALRPLLDLTTDGRGPRLDFGAIQFRGESE